VFYDRLIDRSIREKALDEKDGHVPNIGSMVEEMEGSMRNSLQQVYFGWCEQVIASLRNAGKQLPENVINDLKTKTKI